QAGVRRGGGERAAGDVLRRDIEVAVRAWRLHEPELGDVARHGRLGDFEALADEGIDDLALAADGSGGDEFADRPLSKSLELLRGSRVGRGHPAAPTPASRVAVMRVPKVGSVKARSRASGAEPSAMMASAPA